VVLGVKEDKKREVLGIYNRPTESAAGWEDIFRMSKVVGQVI
jgi:putative transposase